MNKLIILLINILLPSLVMASVVEPVVTNNSSAQTVELGTTLTKAIKKYNKSFILLDRHNFLPEAVSYFEGYANELPMAVTGNFNNDGINDALVMGIIKQNNKFVVVALLAISNKSSYKIYKAGQWDTNSRKGQTIKDAQKNLSDWSVYTGLAEKGERQMTNIPKDRNGFKIENFEGRTDLLYFNKQIYKAVPLKR